MIVLVSPRGSWGRPRLVEAAGANEFERWVAMFQSRRAVSRGPCHTIRDLGVPFRHRFKVELVFTELGVQIQVLQGSQ